MIVCKRTATYYRDHISKHLLCRLETDIASFKADQFMFACLGFLYQHGWWIIEGNPSEFHQ